MKVLRHVILLAGGILASCFAVPAGAQESLDQGKSPAQLFASDCSICHKSPQGLAKAGGLLGLDSFLRQHYTASRESAAAIATYLKGMDSGPAAPAAGRPAKRTAKGDGKTKGIEKKPATGESGDAKSGDAKSAEPKPSEPKSSEPAASEPKSTETKASEPKASEPKASEPKPAETPKSD